MVTFLLILVGLIAFNFILLKFSIQSVDGDRKKVKSKELQSSTHSKIGETKTDGIPKAA
ncbi:hypothetical protein [Aquimarina sp. 2201CG14-23]|uniref:hypothetical protein n=1 Tax=Aquimarina mycalae TaxID=3040073 RepID=UPI002478261E|nr:hypothetical protein [Aquimarina sp. 2201CG14-23]MDH7446597.1 hypothetical protein [Aquimarina sp. 2201CG14-23]